MKDFDGGITKFAYDGNGNKTFKEYPNYETAYYFYDACDRIIEMDEYNIGGKKLFKTTYSWDAEGNRLSEMQYNHGQSGSGSGNKSGEDSTGTASAEALEVEIPTVDTERLNRTVSVVNRPELPDPTADTAAGVVLKNQSEAAQETNIRLLNTIKDDASVEGNGDGNGQVPPGQTEEEDGTIVNPGGNTPPGLNRGEKGEKPDNPNKPVKPDNPGTEDSADKKANQAGKGTHKYGYDKLNRMTSSNIAGTATTYTYDTLGNLVLEKTKNKVVDYQYNELNQLTKKKEGSESYSYTYDKRGNRTAEIGKKASRSYVYDETNRMAESTNWKGDKSAYTYNGLGLRVNNTHTTHAGKVYARDYVIDYTSFENDDLMVFAEGNGQLEYEQKHVYAGSERIEQFTDKGNWERTLYVHEDVMGNTRYYTKANGQSFAELTYDAWGMPESPNKLLNNDHGNYVFATFTGHIYDTTLDIYFAEARFYDANNRTWLAIDPIKDGGNWYQYCFSNPTTYYDPTGLAGFSPFSGCVDISKLVEQMSAGDEQNSIIEGIRTIGKVAYVIYKSVADEFKDSVKDLNGTVTVKGTFNATAYVGIYIDIGLSFDWKGNTALQWSYAIPGVDDTLSLGVLDIGATISVAFTDANDIYELLGKSSAMGVSTGFFKYLSFDLLPFRKSVPTAYFPKFGEYLYIFLFFVQFEQLYLGFCLLNIEKI